MYSLCPPDSRPYKKTLSFVCTLAKRKKNFLCVFSSVQKLVLNRAKTNHLLRWRKSWFWIGPKPTTSCGDFLSLAVTSSRTLWLPLVFLSRVPFRRRYSCQLLFAGLPLASVRSLGPFFFREKNLIQELLSLFLWVKQSTSSLMNWRSPI